MNSLDTSSSRRMFHAPRVLFVLFLAILAVGLAVQWRDAGASPALAYAMVGLYTAWVLYEAPITFQASTTMKETRTLLPYGLARGAVMAATLCAPHAAAPLPLSALGLLLFVAGVLMREIAIKTLGRFYTHHVARRTDQVAVTTGLYRAIRHPAYCGMLVAHVGLVLAFPTPLAALCLALLFAAVIRRILVEERVLWDMPGYAEYARAKPRLLPGIW
ncbi:methyltransferase family protein [Burkholderia gladioli]|uniref:methyltransferase family protein n=1 Tax=Burkholderia gladioli TaxID=28095 RepID=UPI00163F9AF5|nr:isoprenylcysteine carboxylmethyltransferase family protein [Burkholderia gladioli]